ncbi:MAG: AAA family ATPase, partial [Acidobacteriota bacterium]|nr:AAA family ATPase [Acidobacteriota bacterium]
MRQLIDTEIEATVLGSILVGGEPIFRDADLAEQEFTTETHRTVFRAMCEIVAEVRPTIEAVAQRLIDRGDLEKVGGIAGIVDIHAKAIPGLRIAGLAGTLRELTRKRRASKVSELIAAQVSLGLNADGEGIKRLAEELAELATTDSGIGRGQRVEDLPAVACAAECIRYVREPELPAGSVIALTGDSGSGKSTIATAFVRDAIAKGIPCLILDRETPRPVAVDRMQRLDLADSELLRWWGGWNGDAPAPDSPKVVQWVRSCEARPIVVIDSLIAFLEGDENDATAMRAFMHGSRRLADIG